MNNSRDDDNTDGWCWKDANRLRKLRKRIDRLIVERADLRRRLAARREITSILETNLQEQLKRTEAEDEEFKERVKTSAGRTSAEERKTARVRQWTPKFGERFKEEDEIKAAEKATNAKGAKEGKGVAKIKAAGEAEAAARIELARRANEVEDAMTAQSEAAVQQGARKAAEEARKAKAAAARLSDNNGILNVGAEDKGTGKSEKITSTNGIDLMPLT